MRLCVSWYFCNSSLALKSCNFEYQLSKTDLYLFHLIRYCLWDFLLVNFHVQCANISSTSQLCFFDVSFSWDIDSVVLSALDHLYKSFMILDFFRYMLNITSWIFQFWEMFSLQALLNFASTLNDSVHWAESFLFSFLESLYL